MRLDPNDRPKFESMTYTVVALVFFFGVGLAGGTAYQLLPGQEEAVQTAEADPPAELMAPADMMATRTAPDTSADDRAAQDLSAIVPTAGPPDVPQATDPVAAAPSSPLATTLATRTLPDSEPAMTAKADPIPAPAPQKPHVARPISAAKPSVAERQPAPPAKKPEIAEKTDSIIHAPLTAPANAVGPYRIQFGAFANEDNARRVQWAVEASGMQVEVAHTTNSTGHLLYYLRSPSYSEYGVALSAAQTVQNTVQRFINAIPIDFVIFGDQGPPMQQAQFPSR